MFRFASLKSLLLFGSATLFSVVSAAQQSIDNLPRKLLQTSTTSTVDNGYNGFFDHSRPSECGYVCRVVVIAVGGGLVVLALLSLLICCCCCTCTRRRRKTRTTVVDTKPEPYNYQASPAIVPASSATGTGAGVGAVPYTAPSGTTASYGGTNGNYGDVAPGSQYGVPARNTTPGTYNPRKF